MDASMKEVYSPEAKSAVSRPSILAAEGALEQELSDLSGTVLAIIDRLEPILRPEEPVDPSVPIKGGSPENSRLQNMTWSAASNVYEMRLRLQRLLDRIDI